MKRIVVKPDGFDDGIWKALWEDGGELHRSGVQREAPKHARRTAKEHGTEAILFSRSGDVALRTDFSHD